MDETAHFTDMTAHFMDENVFRVMDETVTLWMKWQKSWKIKNASHIFLHFHVIVSAKKICPGPEQLI